MSAAGGSGRLLLARNVLVVVALILAIAVTVQTVRQRSLQSDIEANAELLQNGQTLANLNNSLIQIIVQKAVETDDEQLKALLAENGISYRQQAQAAAPAGPAAPASNAGEGS